MELIQLDIIGLSNSQTQSGAFALVLAEVTGKRRLPIVIGSFEAKAIAMALDPEYKSQRPITHDLFLSVSKVFGLKVKKIVISSINSNGIFSSIIYFEDENGKQAEIDSRTSDAVAIAVRYKAPIFTFDAIMDEAGILLDNDLNELPTLEEDDTDNEFSGESDAELQKQMKSAIENEDYELASKIRDELNKRSNS
ncbi:MAG: bifunctional nuclease domain-containing protein [Flavobacteriales bacterium]